MPRKKKTRRRRTVKAHKVLDQSEFLLMRTTSLYLYRHLKNYPGLGLDDDFFELYSFGLNANIGEIFNRALAGFQGEKHDRYESLISDIVDSDSMFNDIIPCVLERAPKPLNKALRTSLLEILKERVDALEYEGQSELDENLDRIKEMFNLTNQEMDFCLFLYISYTNRRLGTYFVDELNCQRLNGRKYLANALAMTKTQLNRVLSGTLRKIEFFEMDSDCLDINHDFLFMFEDPSISNITEKFFQRVPKNTIPLEFHHGVQQDLKHILDLMKRKTKTPTHILLYGAPGTGKSSSAVGLAKELGIDAYAIAKDDDNSSKNRRASIFACLNMTNGGDGSLIVVDEADNILNTRMSFFFRGETQDKGWLNYLLEQPGARMIWIANEIDNIASSVLRRFAFSVHFKPFNKRQRVLLWENVLKTNKARRYFNQTDIGNFAKNHKSSAGVIDMAIKKAMETRTRSKKKIQKSVKTALEAHQVLINGGHRPMDKEQIEEGYSLEGLEIDGDIQAVLERLGKFDDYLRNPKNTKIINFNFLFHGPPGTGKSELARYIAERLDREVITKRVSDLQSMWVGEGEKNIRDAFQEAEREEAVLVIDEADSLLFSRDRAIRSWEISFTNEFLTRMERHRGILICTTNRLKDLDQASIRRFQEKIGFDYLDGDGNFIFYGKFFKELLAGPLDPEKETRLREISNLAPGDFKVVRDRYAFQGKQQLTHDVLLGALEAEARIKKAQSGGNSIGF